MTDDSRFTLPSRPVSFGDTKTLLDRSTAKATELREQGLVETAEMISRMVDRSLRQERMLHEERDRCHELEMKLAGALAQQRANGLKIVS